MKHLYEIFCVKNSLLYSSSYTPLFQIRISTQQVLNLSAHIFKASLFMTLSRSPITKKTMWSSLSQNQVVYS